MPKWAAKAPILALIYDDSVLADACLRGIAAALKTSGWRLAGLVQHNQARPQRRKCDMHLEDLASGAVVRISEDRGPDARGCVLMVGELLAATEGVRASLASRPDAVILNKFGKTEAEGGGMRDLIFEVVERGLPLVMAVPRRNLDAWHAFAADLSAELLVGAPEDTLAEALRLLTGKPCVLTLSQDVVTRADCHASGEHGGT